MVSGKLLATCDRLPFKLTVCPCCGEGYRPSRTLRQIDPEKMLGGVHVPCNCSANCYVCNPTEPLVSKQVGHYLEWIGEGFYKTPEDFSNEAATLGISRRLKTGIPRQLVVGQSIIFVAHRKVLVSTSVKKTGGKNKGFTVREPAIFSAFIVKDLEHICTEKEKMLVDSFLNLSKKNKEKIEPQGRTKKLLNLLSKGVKLIAVPDDDQDHR